MNRHDIQRAIDAGFILLKTDFAYVRAILSSDAIRPLETPSGQAIDDIIVGSIGEPRDEQYLIEFYKASVPMIPEMQIPLNARATLRWVAIPTGEIRLAPTDQLCWRIAYGDDPTRSFAVVVFTRGRCLASGRVILNQSEFAA